jgi:hypothetical protein
MADPAPQTPTTPENPSQYIRTYAKDVAMLTGAKAPVPLQTSHFAAKESQTESEGVVMPEFDPSPIQSSVPVSPKEYEAEVLETSSSDADDIFQGTGHAAAAPSAPAVPHHGFSSIPRSPISITPVVATADARTPEEKEAERKAFFARLNTSAARFKPGIETAEAVRMPEPVIEDIAAQPAFNPQESGSITSVPTVSRPAPAMIPLPVPPVPIPENLHTYTSDFADRIDQKSASTFSVLAAQGDTAARPATPLPALKKRSSLLPITAGIILILIGGTAAFGAYEFIARPSGAQPASSVPSLIVPDETTEVLGEGSALMQSIANIAAQPSVDGTVIVTYVTSASTTPLGLARIPQPGGTLIGKLGMNAPDILLRNIDESSTVGVVDGGSETHPFFIFKVTSYERTFAGMLAWEQTIGTDLSLFYPAYADTAPTLTGATSTSVLKTKAAAPPIPATPPHFVDAIVANHDVRILKDTSGRSILLYGYVDKQTLVITRNEASFAILIGRLASGGTQR